MAGDAVYGSGSMKRDQSKLGIDSMAKLTQPIPADRLVCRPTAAARTFDDGERVNEFKSLDLLLACASICLNRLVK